MVRREALIGAMVMALTLTATAQPSEMRVALAAINQYRTANGLLALSGDQQLVRAATQQVDAMARLGTVSHDAGGPFASRMQAFGIRGLAAENLGYGYADVNAAVAAWQASPMHSANLLNPGVTRLGLASRRGADGRLFWALVLAR